MFRRLIITSLTALLCLGSAWGQGNAFNAGRSSTNDNKGASAFNAGRKSNFNDYRQKLNIEYVSQMRKQWNPFNDCRGIDPPDRDDKPVAPVRCPDDDANRERQDRRIVIDEVVRPQHDRSRVDPVAPIQEYPDNGAGVYDLSFYGTKVQVRRPSAPLPSLRGTDENSVADMFEALARPEFNNLVIDCIKLRSQLKLCDWAYLQMLKQLSQQIYSGRNNEAVMLMAFIYSQSGYRMRIGRHDNMLDMLYASKHNLYSTRYYPIDDERFYPMNKAIGSLQVCGAKFPKEKSMSLWIDQAPEIGYASSQQRSLRSERYTDFDFNITTNTDLVKLYDTYPTSEVGGNFMTRWAMYANTPLDARTRQSLYPQIQTAIAGLSPREATEKILNWVQTAFVYEYDSKVWGQDRAFFAEETLQYPYCDCEDRSILFTRMVRDLLHLDCVLVYYPGHLAAAVCFPEDVAGDYIEHQGRRFTVCDPTYIHAPIGRTMPNMDNSKAKVILLQ